jgi:hypothetical protein
VIALALRAAELGCEPGARQNVAQAGAAAFGLRLPTALDSFAAQWSYVVSVALLNAICCSRRAGKTNAAIFRAILVVARPNTRVHYVNLVRRNARKQFWRPLLTQLRQLGWVAGLDYIANENDMILTTRWGSTLQAMSCDSMAGTKAVQGDRSDLFMIDECHLPNDDVLEVLVEVAIPMLTDTGGQLDLLGLPPEAEPTYFSRALDRPGWAKFHWTQFDHDFPSTREVKWSRVKKACADRGLKVDVTEAHNDNGRLVLIVGPGTDPLVQRQYFGIRARDPSKFAYEYQPGRNDYDPTPVDLSKGFYRIGWGIDIGWGDCDAIVVSMMSYDDPARSIRVLWQWQRNHLDVFDLAALVMCVREVLPPHHESVTGDHGGHGATKTMKSLETVLGIPIHSKPGDVMLSVGFMNDDFRAGRLLIPTRDLYTTAIATAARRVLAGEPERLVVVLAMLGVDPDDTAAEAQRLFAEKKPERLVAVLEILVAKPASLAAELPHVPKALDPRTGKLVVNKKGKGTIHSDVSEALRYCHSGLIRSPAYPETPPAHLDPEAEAEARVDAQIERWNAQMRYGRRR